VGILKTYHVTAELAGCSRKRTLWNFLFAVALFMALEFLWRRAWHNLTGRDVFWGLIEAIFFAALAVSRDPMFPYDLIVFDDAIVSERSWFKRSVRKDEVRTVSESFRNPLNPPGLQISKYGSLGTFLWGCVWVPKALPDYEYVKNLALTWKAEHHT